MKIKLHAGFHKTGTTTIQTLLNKHYSTPIPGKTWYPPTAHSGPGHSDIAIQSLPSLDGTPADTGTFHNILQLALESDVESILLSSEDFSFAWPNRLGALRDLFYGHELQIIFTISPYIERAVSLWKEMVKHGYKLSLSKSWPDVLMSPGFSPNIVKDFIYTLRPKKTTLIISDHNDDPLTLIENLWSELQLDFRLIETTAKQNLKINRSFSYLSTELLRKINNIDIKSSEVRSFLINYLLLSEEWKIIEPYIRRDLSSKASYKIWEIAQKSVDGFEALQAAGKLDIIGDVRTLLRSDWQKDDFAACLQ